MVDPTPLEIELKFRVAEPDTFIALAQPLVLGDFHLQPAEDVEQQYNIYFDTPDFRLRARRFGLRLRQLGARRIVTLKGETQARDGLHQRAEWEMPVESDDPLQWPAGEARDRAFALAGDAPLQPILVIQTTRRHVYAWRGSRRIAEIALDDGVIRAAGHEQAFRELEVELLAGGERADLDALGSLLRRHFGLQPDDRSKLARGMALLEGRPAL